MFELATEALPNAWSAWNSLGEAYLLLSWNPESARGAGDLRDKAEACYAKSVALNPRNDKARYDLNELRAAKFDAANETKTPLRFVPGAQTKLTGPYLGQPAPGLAPRVFAPGIVSVAGHFDFGITFTPDGKEFYFSESAAMTRFFPTFRLAKHSRDAIRRFVTSNMSCETIPPARRPPN